jgi:hypothetical protein
MESIVHKLPSLIDSRLEKRLNPVVNLVKLNLPKEINPKSKNKCKAVSERRRARAPGPLRLTIEEPFKYGRRPFIKKVDDFLSFLEMESVSFPSQAPLESKCDFFRAVENAKIVLRDLKGTIFRFNNIAAMTEQNRQRAQSNKVFERSVIQSHVLSKRNKEAMKIHFDSLRGHPIAYASNSSQREQEVYPNNAPCTSMRRQDISLFPVVTIQEVNDPNLAIN